MIEANRKLHADLSANNITHVYNEYPSEHNWPYWMEHIREHLLFFNKQLISYSFVEKLPYRLRLFAGGELEIRLPVAAAKFVNKVHCLSVARRYSSAETEAGICMTRPEKS